MGGWLISILTKFSMLNKLDNVNIAVLHLYNVDEDLPNEKRCFHDKIDYKLLKSGTQTI